jgi:hypothetical protein
MVVFDQLRISDDGKKLYLDIHISEEAQKYFTDPFIEKITICTDEDVSESISYAGYIYRKEISSDTVSLILDKSSFDAAFAGLDGTTATKEFSGTDLSHNLFFVFVDWSGTPKSECIPCGADESPIVGVTFDYGIIYNNAMNFTRELTEDCTVPNGFIDFILNLSALKFSIGTGHYYPAIKYFNTLIGKGNRFSTVKGCGCHG